MKLDRRLFLKSASLAAVSLSHPSLAASLNPISKPQQFDPSVIGLTVPEINIVRVAVIGVGDRGTHYINQLLNIDGVSITAICDTDSTALDKVMEQFSQRDLKAPDRFTGNEQTYLDLLTKNDIDIVIICTPWEWHAPMAIDAMESGKHVLVEAPMALSVEECWQIVNTSEKTQKNCMMMESINYGRDALMVLNMVRKGVLGELLHAEASYNLKLHKHMQQLTPKMGNLDRYKNVKLNGSYYPTHGLGPVSLYMDIHRGDRFDYITAMTSPSSPSSNQDNREQQHPLKGLDVNINTSLIKTVKGRTIIINNTVNHGSASSVQTAPHSRIQGTKGSYISSPNRIVLSSNTNEQYLNTFNWEQKYQHPLWQQLDRQTKHHCLSHNMDFLMLWRVVYCLRNGEPLDQNVYDGAALSVVSILSEISISNRSHSVNFPDFTRGQWQT
ncbi:Gfo/Idh/MocA family protein [Shewanella youngdeokensis]|uniref:Gfo/Idh/MocA family oxidoreductase n=1 Tax=Shewanella youngdeokensis TaxID=2999068 RepID=A0ABZ0K1G0_9GAMM|nr:Gfo/Idh/MocA family oxidoreductase [Shewanella sp. DAU334]